jgi:hypothetical protein
MLSSGHHKSTHLSRVWSEISLILGPIQECNYSNRMLLKQGFLFNRHSKNIVTRCSLQSQKQSYKMKTREIILTPREDKLATLLVETTHHLFQTQQNVPKVTLRFAGGWVRDKVCDIECNLISLYIDIQGSS